MEERRYICPCCGVLTGPRATPLTAVEAERGFAIMVRKGWTSERLLAEQAEALDYIAPGMTNYLRWIEEARPGGPAL